MIMKLDLRDELAARIAAALAESTLSPRAIAVRAYATADALVRERAEPARLDLDVDGPIELGAEDLAPPHDPRWELEPRWSEDDRARRDRAVARHDAAGPGLAATRPSAPDAEERETG